MRLVEGHTPNGITRAVFLVRLVGQMNNDQFILGIGAHVGGCLVDGLGDGVMVQAPGVEKDALRMMCFGLLQVSHDLLIVVTAVGADSLCFLSLKEVFNLFAQSQKCL